MQGVVNDYDIRADILKDHTEKNLPELENFNFNDLVYHGYHEKVAQSLQKIVNMIRVQDALSVVVKEKSVDILINEDALQYRPYLPYVRQRLGDLSKHMLEKWQWQKGFFQKLRELRDEFLEKKHEAEQKSEEQPEALELLKMLEIFEVLKSLIDATQEEVLEISAEHEAALEKVLEVLYYQEDQPDQTFIEKMMADFVKNINIASGMERCTGVRDEDLENYALDFWKQNAALLIFDKRTVLFKTSARADDHRITASYYDDYDHSFKQQTSMIKASPHQYVRFEDYIIMIGMANAHLSMHGGFKVGEGNVLKFGQRANYKPEAFRALNLINSFHSYLIWRDESKDINVKFGEMFGCLVRWSDHEHSEDLSAAWIHMQNTSILYTSYFNSVHKKVAVSYTDHIAPIVGKEHTKSLEKQLAEHHKEFELQKKNYISQRKELENYKQLLHLSENVKKQIEMSSDELKKDNDALIIRKEELKIINANLNKMKNSYAMYCGDLNMRNARLNASIHASISVAAGFCGAFFTMCCEDDSVGGGFVMMFSALIGISVAALTYAWCEKQFEPVRPLNEQQILIAY